MTLKIAEFPTFVSVGFGTYFGLIFVFLKSSPTSDVPLGIITPPLILLNLWRILSACVRSNTELEVRENSVVAFVSAPLCDTAFAEVPDALIAYPGLLSTICSPGYSNTVSYTHLTLPTTPYV